MKRRIIHIFTALISIVLFYGTFIKTPIGIANHSSPSAEIQQTAPLLKNLGAYHHPISTKSELAQRYFDQGLILTYGFNQLEPRCCIRRQIKLRRTSNLVLPSQTFVRRRITDSEPSSKCRKSLSRRFKTLS